MENQIDTKKIEMWKFNNQPVLLDLTKLTSYIFLNDKKNNITEKAFEVFIKKYIENKYFDSNVKYASICFSSNILNNHEPYFLDNSLSNEEKLTELVFKIEHRLTRFFEEGVKNIWEFNKKNKSKMFHLVIIIDNIDKLINKNNENLLKLLRLGRAVGFHIISKTNKGNSILNSEHLLWIYHKIITFYEERFYDDFFLTEEHKKYLEFEGNAVFVNPMNDIVNINLK